MQRRRLVAKNRRTARAQQAARPGPDAPPAWRVYRSFPKARAFVHSLKLKNFRQWVAYSQGKLPRLGRLPRDIPAYPPSPYEEKGWQGYGDWLGTGTIAPRLRQYRSFFKARAFVCNLGLKSRREWQQFCAGRMPKLGRLPADIPSNPNLTYGGKGWKGFGDWLGTGTIAPQLKQYRPFRQARAFVRRLQLKTHPEW